MSTDVSYTHHAVVGFGGPPRPECGGVGRCVMRLAEVDCPDCQQLEADRQARLDQALVAVADAQFTTIVKLAERLEQAVTEAREVLEQLESAPVQDVMSPGAVQEMLGISRKTLSAWAQNGLIPFVPLPSGHRRYLRSEIEAMLRKKATK